MPVYLKQSRAKSPRCADKRWQVVVEHHGLRAEFIVYGTRRDALDKEAAERTKLKVVAPSARNVERPFSRYCACHYRPHAELKLKASSWYRAKFMVATLVGFFGDKRIDRLSQTDVEDFQRARKADGVSHVTINNELRILRRVLNHAAELGLPTKGSIVKFLDEPERRVRAWDDRQVKALLAAVVDVAPEVLRLAVFLLNTGCRKGEAIALKWENVDLKRRLINIWPSDDWQPKSGKPREVPIPDALLPFLKGARESKVWVFPSRAGSRYAHWPKHQFDRARKAAGLVGGPHTCRHTFASHFLKRRPDLPLLAEVLGHSDTAVTSLYAHLLPDHLDRARNAVNFRSPVGPKAAKQRAEARVSALASRAGRAPRRPRRTVEPSKGSGKVLDGLPAGSAASGATKRAGKGAARPSMAAVA